MNMRTPDPVYQQIAKCPLLEPEQPPLPPIPPIPQILIHPNANRIVNSSVVQLHFGAVEHPLDTCHGLDAAVLQARNERIGYHWDLPRARRKAPFGPDVEAFALVTLAKQVEIMLTKCGNQLVMRLKRLKRRILCSWSKGAPLNIQGICTSLLVQRPSKLMFWRDLRCTLCGDAPDTLCLLRRLAASLYPPRCC
ncbi:hypothetical protein EJ02DRAFT_452294 [Clathrospora elynae]|uniref:Uncharacterized protein n=1 Tax=Clathrospora elynae TaxID=706981 RepID=A0A6A5SYC2_9PLEO|nr:hypothetical protein EJ02DRAFT_452294 [Clathrospora elynae]